MIWRFGWVRVMVLTAMLTAPVAAQAEGLAALPPGLIDRIDSAAPRLLEDAGAVILAYGTDGRIDAAGIEVAIDHARARRRANALARLLEADLDGDGVVSANKVTLALRAADPAGQARAKLAHDRADADGDGAVSAVEARAAADRQALRGYSEKTAQKLRDLLTMDMDGDAQIGLDEVAAVIARRIEAATLAAQGGSPQAPPVLERDL